MPDLIQPTRIPNVPILEFELPENHDLLYYLVLVEDHLNNYLFIPTSYVNWSEAGSTIMLDILKIKEDQDKPAHSHAYELWTTIMQYLDVELMKSICTPAYIKIKIL